MPTTPKHPLHRASSRNLVGLAFSGGGIRSATFNLGVLQALARLDLVRRIDHVSSVSGGGYIASWLYAWTLRRRRGIVDVQDSLTQRAADTSSTASSRPITFLREYSNYLTPRLGALGADTWTMISTWARNTLLNQVVLTCALATVLLAVRSLVWLHVGLSTAAMAWMAVALFWVTCVGIGGELARMVVPGPDQRHTYGARTYAAIMKGMWPAAQDAEGLRQGSVELLVAVLFLSALAASVAIARVPLPTAASVRDVFESPYFRALFVGLILIYVFGGFGRCFFASDDPGRFAVACVAHAVIGIVTAFIGARIVLSVLEAIHGAGLSPSTAFHVWNWDVIAFGVPAMVLVFTLIGGVHIGLLGANFPDERREWTARFGAWLLIYSIVWVAVLVETVYVPAWIVVARTHSTTIVGACLWVASTFGGVLAGRSARSGPVSASNDAAASRRRAVAAAGMYLFVVGLIALVSFVVALIAAWLGSSGASPWNALRSDAWLLHRSWPFVEAAVGMVVVTLGLALRINVNEFSMHHFYKNRLVRCYLGASRATARRPNAFTGFDMNDDVKLAAFRRQDHAAWPRANVSTSDIAQFPYNGPLPVVNVALNLVGGDNLAWQERKAESFVFTPYYSGFSTTDDRRNNSTTNRTRGWSKYGFRPTRQYAYGNDDGPALGTTVAISGAAANPNMGYQSSPAASFLMTVFNARLGWWMGNPRRNWKWRHASPRNGLLYLVAELFGQTNDRSAFVNLSDGGHFENLGIYELVRRRCRVIIACDAEEDHDMKFGGLGNAIRKCRTDFGVDIDIDVRPLQRTRPGQLSAMHYAIGEIRYPVGGTGLLIYLKSSVTGDEPTDVLEYRGRHPEFPHESTADQWFAESQFESYRALGEHIAAEALSAAAPTGPGVAPLPAGSFTAPWRSP